MTIKYDNMEFSSVDELIEYKKKVAGESIVAPIPIPAKPVQKDVFTAYTSTPNFKISTHQTISGRLHVNKRNKKIIKRMKSILEENPNYPHEQLFNDISREFYVSYAVVKNLFYKRVNINSKYNRGRVGVKIRPHTKIHYTDEMKSLMKTEWDKCQTPDQARNVIEQLAKKFGITFGAMRVAYSEKLNKRLSDFQAEQPNQMEQIPQQQSYMIKPKPVVPVPYEQQMHKIANESKPQSISFPDFPLLTFDSLKIFKSIIKNVIENKSQLTYQECIDYLDMEQGMKWSFERYENFIFDFMTKSKYVSDYFSADNNFKIVTGGKFKILKYE